MNIHILGVFNEGFASYFFGQVIFIFLIVVLIQAVVMTLMKYNSFKESLTQALIMNIVAVVLGFFLIRLFPEKFSSYGLSNQLPLFAITFAAELATLYFLNPKKPFANTIAVCVLMNLVSYLSMLIFKIG